MSDFDVEPIRGLPELLPEGEELRWQGAPAWGGLAIRAFHVRKVLWYFGLLIVLRVLMVLFGGESAARAFESVTWLLVLAAVSAGILLLLAWLYGRSTVYSITSQRVVIRFGLALPMSVNLPFKRIESAGVRVYPDGTGDIPLVLQKAQQVNYFILWPNVRPWQFSNPQPMLRAVPDGQRVAGILSEALKAAAAEARSGAAETQDGQAAEPMTSAVQS